MTAPRLILCPPTAAALDRLNDCRELDAKIAAAERKAKKSGDYGPVDLLTLRRSAAAWEFVDELLAGAVYTDAEPDPRVAALEARIRELERSVELHEWTAYQRRQHPDLTDREIFSRIVYVSEWREQSESLPSGTISSGSVGLHGGKPIRKGEHRTD